MRGVIGTGSGEREVSSRHEQRHVPIEIDNRRNGSLIGSAAALTACGPLEVHLAISASAREVDSEPDLPADLPRVAKPGHRPVGNRRWRWSRGRFNRPWQQSWYHEAVVRADPGRYDPPRCTGRHLPGLRDLEALIASVPGSRSASERQRAGPVAEAEGAGRRRVHPDGELHLLAGINRPVPNDVVGRTFDPGDRQRGCRCRCSWGRCARRRRCGR